MEHSLKNLGPVSTELSVYFEVFWIENFTLLLEVEECTFSFKL